jgi:trimeric autotransporter adhesin
MHIQGPIFSGSIRQADNAYAYLSGSFTGSFIGDGSGLTGITGGSDSTGSLLSSASLAGNNLNFTKGDNSTFSIDLSSLASSGSISDTSFNSFTGSTQTSISNLNTYTSSTSTAITSLNNYTSSTSTSISNLTNFTSSTNTSISNLNSYTSSTSTSISNLTSYTASTDTSISNLNSFTSSTSTSISNLNNFTSSTETSITNLTNFSGSTITTASIAGQTLTFTKGDESTFSVNLPSTAASGTVSPNTVSSSTQITDLGFVSQSGGIVDLSGVKVQYSNVYSTLGDLPSASSYHGMFAHVHATGQAYFAHAGQWIELATSSSISNVVNNVTVNNATTASYVSPTFISESVAASGFGTGGGGGVSSYNDLTDKPTLISGSVQIEALGFVTSSAATTASYALTATTASYALTATTASHALTATSASHADTVPFAFISSSFNNITYNGNRVVTNPYLPNLVDNNYNPGTSGSIVDFLNAVFYPNLGAAPVWSTTANQSVGEFDASGTTVFTAVATDSDAGASITYAAQDYSSNYLSVASNGVVTLSTSGSTDYNTNDRGDGTLAHPLKIRATDNTGLYRDRTFYISTIANNTPQFRETSIVGNVISSYTVTLNESNSAGTVTTIYFTDADSDSVSVEFSNETNGHFTLASSSNSVTLTQATASLDYESITAYNFGITASDEHNAKTILPITINVGDNATPVLNSQTLPLINENSNDGDTVGSISATDAEGDTLTFSNFTLARILLDSSDVTQGTYSGTSQLTDPHEDPFQMTSAGLVTRKTGVYLNSDRIDTYIYSASVSDSYNTKTSGLVSVGITPDAAPTITDNYVVEDNWYISETVTSGSTMLASTNGYSGVQADYEADQTVTWTVSPSDIFSIDSNGSLTVAANMSGSYSGGSTIVGAVTASNTFGTPTIETFTLNVIANNAPSVTLNLSSSVVESSATTGDHLGVLTLSDVESNSPFSVTLSGANAASFTLDPQNEASSSWHIDAASDLAIGSYELILTGSDSFGGEEYASASIDVVSALAEGYVYVYHTDTSKSAQSLEVYLGVTGTDSSTTPVTATLSGAYTNALHAFRDATGGGLGASSISGLYGNTTSIDRLGILRSGSNLNDVLTQATYADSDQDTGHYVIAISSGSDMTGVPSTMRDNVGGSTTGEYVFAYSGGGSAYGAETSTIYQVGLNTAHQGYDNWIFIIANNAVVPGSVNNGIQIIPSSGSIPS